MSAAPLLTCRELIEFIAAYLDDELSSRERERFERHLEVCPACVDYLASYRETVRASREAFADEPETLEEVPDELIRAVLASRGGR